MKKLGYILYGFGMLLLLSSFGMDTAPSGTYNIGLMQQQMMFFSLGCALFLGGVISATIGSALSRMEDAGHLPPVGFKVEPSEKGGHTHGGA